MKKRVTIFIAVLSAACLAAQEQTTDDLATAYMNSLSPIQRDLFKACEKIAADRGVTLDEVFRVNKEMNIGARCIPKGSQGIVEGDLFVRTDSEKNEARANRVTIVGEKIQIPELFVFSQGKFVGRLPLSVEGKEDVVVVLFAPDKIKFYDWKNLSGGYYDRAAQTRPNLAPEPKPTAQL